MSGDHRITPVTYISILIFNKRKKRGETRLSIFLPVPGISTHIIKNFCRFPVQFFLCKSRICKANGNISQIEIAYEEFNTEGGQDYKNYLIENFVPVNLEDNFSFITDRENPGVEVSIKFIEFPSNYEEDNGIQQTSWTQAPKVKIMPERLYLLGYREGKVKAEVLGNPIPCPLICGPDPLAEEETLESYLEDDFKISPGMKWMVDFYDAVSNGMGFIVDDVVDEDDNVLAGYDRLIITGSTNIRR